MIEYVQRTNFSRDHLFNVHNMLLTYLGMYIYELPFLDICTLIVTYFRLTSSAASYLTKLRKQHEFVTIFKCPLF